MNFIMNIHKNSYTENLWNVPKDEEDKYNEKLFQENTKLSGGIIIPKTFDKINPAGSRVQNTYELYINCIYDKIVTYFSMIFIIFI